MGTYPGVETPVIPVDPGVLDGGDGVEGIGGGVLATGCLGVFLLRSSLSIP
jgi:hypothetical protein